MNEGISKDLVRKLVSESFYDDDSAKIRKIQKKEARRRYLKMVQVFGLAGIATVGFVLGFIGYWLSFAGSPDDQTVLNVVYSVIKLFFFDFANTTAVNVQLEIAKYLCGFVTGFSTYKGISIVFKENIANFKLQSRRKHVIICGLDRKGKKLAMDLLAEKKKVVVIEVNPQNENILKIREAGALVVVGNAADLAILLKARVHHARYLITTLPDDNLNVEISATARKIKSMQAREAKSKSIQQLTCICHIADVGLAQLVQQQNALEKSSRHFVLKFFSIYSNSARILFHTFAMESCGALEDPSSPIHLLIIGFGSLGENVALQALRMAHYKNRNQLLITVLDKNATMVKSRFLYNHKFLDKNWEERQEQDARSIPGYPDIGDIEFHSINVQNTRHMIDLVRNVNETCPITSAFICIDDNLLSVNCGLELQAFFTKECNRAIPIKIRMDENEELCALLRDSGERSAGEGDCGTISPFALVKDSCSKEVVLQENLDTIARYIHEQYLDSIGGPDWSKPSHRPWDFLPIELKDSNRQAADHIPVKLRMLGLQVEKGKTKSGEIFTFSNDELESLARIEHNRWNAERWLAGWRFQPVNDPENMCTNCLIPFDDLSEEEKDKDRQQVAKIPAILHDGLGLDIQRPSEPSK